MATSLDGHAVVDLNDAGFWLDVNASLRRAREAGSFARTTDGELVLLRFEDVRDAMRDPMLTSFALQTLLASNHILDGPLYEWCNLMMLSMDPPRHTRLRALVSRAFTARQVERVRGSTRHHIRALLDAHRDEGRLDWVADVAHELPIWVICDMIGVPAEDRNLFKQWTVDVSLMFGIALTDDDRRIAEDAMAALNTYSDDLIERRRHEPGDDLLSALIAVSDDGDRLTHDELRAMVPNLLNGGHESTRSMLSLGMLALTDHPDQMALLQRRPELVARAVEELLRYDAPVVSTMRRSSRDLELAGQPVAEGELVHLSIMGANRDPERFAHPDRFDVERADGATVSFGHGIHLCIGAALARLEGQEVLGELVTTCRDVELHIEPVWDPFLQVRRTPTLPITFTSA